MRGRVGESGTTTTTTTHISRTIPIQKHHPTTETGSSNEGRARRCAGRWNGKRKWVQYGSVMDAVKVIILIKMGARHGYMPCHFMSCHARQQNKREQGRGRKRDQTPLEVNDALKSRSAKMPKRITVRQTSDMDYERVCGFCTRTHTHKYT